MANKRNKSLKKIKQSLVEQLEKNGCKTDFYLSLVDDYLYYEEQERVMKDDIANRGLTFTAISAQGKEYDKDNPAIKAAVMFNKQKLAILKQLGLGIETIITDDENDEALL